MSNTQRTHCNPHIITWNYEAPNMYICSPHSCNFVLVPIAIKGVSCNQRNGRCQNRLSWSSVSKMRDKYAEQETAKWLGHTKNRTQASHDWQSNTYLTNAKSELTVKEFKTDLLISFVRQMQQTLSNPIGNVPENKALTCDCYQEQSEYHCHQPHEFINPITRPH